MRTRKSSTRTTSPTTSTFEDASDLEVKKGVKYELKVRYRSDEKKDNESEDFIVFQYKGKWYSMDAMFLVAMATYF